jgi:hypothetical protein
MKLCLRCAHYNACLEQAGDVVRCIEYRDVADLRAAQLEASRAGDWMRLQALCAEEANAKR